MINLTRDMYVDMDSYLEELRYNGYIAYDREAMQKEYLRDFASLGTWARYVENLMAIKSGRIYRSIQKDRLIEYLKDVERCPERYFKIKNEQGKMIKSISKSQVLEKLVGNNHAVDFLQEYFKFVELKSSTGTIRNILDRQQETIGISNDGIELTKMKYSVDPQQNMRCYYKKEDVIGMPKKYVKHFVAEDGYFYIWGDFAQSDMRLVLSLIILTAAQIKQYSTQSDVYKVVYEMMMGFLGKPFSEEEFRAQRDSYKQWCLETVYGTRNSQIGEESAFVQEFTKFLMSTKKYPEYCRRLSARHRLQKKAEIKTYFDNYEILNWKPVESEFVNKGLNTPFQTGSSEIMILVVNTILARATELGIPREKFNVLMCRHDEPVFKVHKSVMPQIYFLENCSTINVPGFLPLRMDFECGYSYDCVDESLMEEYRAVCELNKDKIDNTYIFDENSGIDDYYPVDDVAELKMHMVEIPEIEKTIIVLHNDRNNSSHVSLVDGIGENITYSFIKESLSKLDPIVLDKGYRDFIVTSNFTYGSHGTDLINDTHFLLFEQVADASLSLVTALCDYTVNVYCKKIGIESPVKPPLEHFAEDIKRIKRVELEQLFDL